MSKRLLALLLVGSISVVGVGLAQDPPAKDEPPVRLKKKRPRGDDDKPMVDPDKPAEKKKDDKADEKKKEEKAEPEPEPITPEEEEKEVLQRVVSNVHKVDERLAKGDLGEATQQTQRDILKDLESLIRRNENPPPQGGGGSGQAEQNKDQGGDNDQNNQNQQGGGQGGGGQKNQKQQAGQKSQSGGGGQNGGAGQKNQRSQNGGKSGTKPGAGSPSGKQQRAGNGKQQAGKNGKKSEKPGGKDGKNGNGGGGGSKDDRVRNKNADLDKNDVWGHLPQTLRAQMDAYSNPQPFMPKYDDLIKRYYKTIAEQGRRKGE